MKVLEDVLSGAISLTITKIRFHKALKSECHHNN